MKNTPHQQRCEDLGIRLYSMLDEAYPSRLRGIQDPPAVLYARGDFSLLTRMKGVAVIGARKSTPFGEDIAFRLGEALARRGYNVVSGLALGIDSAAHRGALAAGGATTAVVVDVAEVYPPENAGLAEEIVAGGGLLLAEYPPGQPALRRHLIERDRIQSALSIAVFPVETGVTGGTVHTLRFAAAQGRPVYCLHPEDLRSHSRAEYAEGIAKVVREGAAVYRVGQLEEVTGDLER